MIQDLCAIGMQRSDSKSPLQAGLNLDGNDMHAHDLVDVVDDFDVSMDENKENLNVVFASVEPFHDLTREEGKVEMSLDEIVFTAFVNMTWAKRK